MPVHDWTRVRAGIFHDFHHEWLSTIKHALNEDILPKDYYALVDQHTGDFIPDVLTLEATPDNDVTIATGRTNETALLSKPRRKVTAEAEMDFYRRKKKMVTVRHVSDDGVVAMIEIVSPGNKNARRPMRAFVDKVANLLERQIHMLLADVFQPGRRDPQGIHAAIWEEISGEQYRLPRRKPLTVVSYEADPGVRAYVEHFSIGGVLPEMPLFLEPLGCVEVPLEETYLAAFAEVPKRWRDVLDRE